MAKTQIKDYVFKPGISALAYVYPDAYSLLSQNKSYLQAEATAWIAAQVAAGASGFVGYTFNESKCQRDLGYIIDAYLNDLRYGGNEEIRRVVGYYWEGTTAQVDGDRQPEIQTHTEIRNIINNYILTNTAHTSLQSTVSQVIDGTKTAETSSSFTATDGTYVPTTGNMTITIGSHSLTVGTELFIAPAGITFTCALDGNATLHPYPRASGVPNNTGKDPFYYAPITISAVTSTTVTINVGISSDTTLHTFSSAVTDSISAGPINKISTLAFNVTDVITTGLTALPTLVPTGVTTLKIQGRYEGKELLLITNTTSNEVIYNFTSNELGATVKYKTHGADTDFPKYLQITDTVTTLTLNKDTSLQSSTDDVQLFVESEFIRTKPYDFGVDAIERQRVAAPLAMLDADFEYGLQPTKWSAIGTLRGYPSIYEIPGTNTDVQTVVTDASAGTSGVGQSLITVTSVSPHGFQEGEPITIKALENSIAGAARAEGSFVINTTPTTLTFTYYAKAKVGTNSGDVLATSYTQLRKAGFYTGAAIGSPQLAVAIQGFTVVAQGASGVLTSELVTPLGTTIVPYDGTSPAVGAPLVVSQIPTGSQVTGVIDQSAGGGSYLTPQLANDVPAGSSSMTLVDATGVLANLALDNGTGTAIFVETVNYGSNVITLSDPTTGPYTGNVVSYSNVPGTSYVSIGQNVAITVVSDGTDYTVSNITTPGTGYLVGDRLTVSGSSLSGTTPTNDLIVRVSTVDSNNGVTALTVISGTPFDGAATFNGLTPSTANGTGTGATWTGSYTDNVYSTVVLGGTATGYAVADRIIILGSVFGENGVDGTHDLIISIAAVDGGGSPTSTTQTGTAPDAVVDFVITDDSTQMVMSAAGSHLTFNNIGSADSSRTAGSYIGVTGTSGGSGTVGTFNITVDAVGTATVNRTTNIGAGHTAGDTITVADGVLGGGGAANLTFDVATIGNGAGIDAGFTVRTNGTTYTLTNITPGSGFIIGETITVPGTEMNGATTANDLLIEITTVTGTGGLGGFQPIGTAVNSATWANAGTNLIGSGFIADISFTGGTYSIDFTSPGDGGTNYGLNQTFVVPGNTLNGATPANDATITITGVIDDDSTARGEVTTVTISGSSSTGIGTFTNSTTSNIQTSGSSALFNVTRTSDDSTGTYENIVTANATGYVIGDKVTISGTALGGTSPSNDLILIADGADFSSVSLVSGTPAAASILNLICTFTMTEATTANMPANTSISFEALATLEVDFPNAHGLVPGNSFIVTQQSDDGSNNHNLAAGAFIATDIPALDKLRYQARAAGPIDVSSSDILGVVYPRPDSFFIHRPFDGGVQLGTGGPQHGAQAIRQSKKYIRYQSGKGIMYTTGALLAPSYDLQSVTSDGVELNSLITVTCDDNDHGCQVGGIVRLIGIQTAGYNSGPGNSTPPDFDYEVVGIVDERSFQIRSNRRLGSTTADLGFNSQMSVVSWHGATVRAGVFDDQNGIFWEYDGTNVNVVQRTGTFQLSGTITMLADANIVTGSYTKFTKQLKAGDRVIIKGMTHVVTTVGSDTNIAVTPDFRGVNNITGAKMMYITDKKVKQSDFNIDRLDGTGKSGYNMDPAKMQMIGIQYSWYGAGFIDFMVRGADGNFIYSHRMRNSNVNTEAFMRSGNLPVRYEITNEGPPGQLVSAINSSQLTIPLVDSSFFPTAGTLYIDNEIITFSGNNKATNTLTGAVRAATFSNYQAGATRSYTAGVAAIHVIKTGVVLISSTITPLISHWGSAFLTDGGFDEDRGYIFSYAETNISVSTTKQTAFLLRLSPSVSNAIIGDLGERELLNRAQLLLNGIEITSESGAGGIIVEGVLNPQNYPINPSDIGWSGLSGLAQGGQPSFAQVASGSSVAWSSGATPTTASATALATTTAVLDSGIYNVGNNNSYVFIGAADYRTTFGTNNLDNVLGKVVTGTNIRSGTTISGGYIANSGTYGYFYLSNRTSGSISANSSDHFSIVLNDAQVNSNKALFDTSSWISAGAGNGTSTTGGSVTWPASTLVNNVALKSWAGTSYYEVTFNNAFTGTLANGSGTVEFTFEQPPYALPGETVFSYIAVPGERSTQDLSQLKEITNTPLGGRGTFPNGPDVLAINVYKISGATLNANILLKWGEAQA
jgi:hypothetical protein